MNGYNGAPDIWKSTKQFLKAALEKESGISMNSQMTILPFKDNPLPAISVNPRNISWENIERALDNYIIAATYTNICDAWKNAENNIDPTRENYLVLMTDGVDNIGGTANVANRSRLLASMLSEFCGKYPNTKGFYVMLTQDANVTGDVLQAIDMCEDINIVDARDGIPDFTGMIQNEIYINTRDLACDLDLGFSNPGTFEANIEVAANEYVDISLKNGKISCGKAILHVAIKDNLNLAQLNKLIGKDNEILIPLKIVSDEVTITNPDIDLIICAADLRTLNLCNIGNDNNFHTTLTRTRPFLWIKGNDIDTLRWDLSAKFNECALEDDAYAIFRINSENTSTNCKLLYNSNEIAEDSLINIVSGEEAILELTIPTSEFPGKAHLTLTQAKSRNLDRINDKNPQQYIFTLDGNYDSELSWLEWFSWILLALIATVALLWFLLIKRAKYPVFKRGIITVSSPYFSTIRLKGNRKIVFTPIRKSQGILNTIVR